MSEKPNIPLAAIQKWMQESLLNPQHTGGDNRSVNEPNTEVPGLNGLIKNSQRLSARDHLAIYQRSYVARLRDCMAKQFSALEFALGNDLFRGFADAYLQQYPSTNYNLISLGENFPAYLEATRPDRELAIKEDWPDFMIELARFEYAINIIFEEKGEEDYALATTDTAESNLQIVPVFYVFQFQFPIRHFYTAFARNEAPELPLPEQTFCAILRHNYQLSIHDLNRGQYVFLQYLSSGKSIAEAKQQLLTQNAVKADQLELFWPTWKQKWVDMGFFREIS